jgi:hypothetical protein
MSKCCGAMGWFFGFSQFDEAYESTFIAGLCGERFLAHLLS